MKLTILLTAVLLFGQDQASALKLGTETKLAKSLHTTMLAQSETLAQAHSHKDLASAIDWIQDMIKWLEDKWKFFIEMVEEYKKRMRRLAW